MLGYHYVFGPLKHEFYENILVHQNYNKKITSSFGNRHTDPHKTLLYDVFFLLCWFSLLYMCEKINMIENLGNRFIVGKLWWIETTNSKSKACIYIVFRGMHKQQVKE
jgi:hypothetical protein